MELEQVDPIDVHFQGQDYAGYLHLETLYLDQDTVTLAHFKDGRPAATLHPIGRGYGLYIATHADAAYTDLGSLFLKDLLRVVLEKLGIRPRVLLDYVGGDKREVDPHLLMGEARATILIVNYLDDIVEGKLSMELDQLVKRVEIGLEELTDLPFKQKDGRLYVPLHLSNNEPIEAVNIYW